MCRALSSHLVIVAKPPHFKPEPAEPRGGLRQPAQIGITKRSDVRVLVAVRRSEKSPGRVQPPIDDHDTVALWPEVILE